MEGEEKAPILKFNSLDYSILTVEMILVKLLECMEEIIDEINKLRIDKYCIDREEVFENHEKLTEFLKKFKEMSNNFMKDG
jgi:hypothetical protein